MGVKTGCGGCFSAALYLVSVLVIVLGSVVTLAERVQSGLIIFEGDSLDILLSEDYPDALITAGKVSYVTAAAGLIALLLIVAGYRARFRREHGAFAGGPETDWDKRRGAVQKPVFRVAKILSVLAVCASLVSVALSVVVVRLNSVSEQFFGTAIAAAYVLLILTVILAVVIVILLFVGGLWRGGKTPTKAQLVSEELQNIFGAGVCYMPKGSLANNPLSTGLVSGSARPEKSNDHIYGQYKGLDFERADVSFSALHKVYNTNSEEYEDEWRTIFSGQWMVARMQKTIPGRVLIYSKAACAHEKAHIDYLQKNGRYTEVALEETAFGDFFRIFAENPHDAFYVLTPPVMERLKRLAGAGAVNPDAGMSLYVGFYGGMLHIGINSGHDAFDGAITLSVSEAETRARIRADMQIVVDIMESLL
ncbi:MAG: DUF3137 domain-containing protein [Clostridiales Family XIII bacterium]|jgi:hypothetical protein|nr:DUF3137 domain-containing protein [Clostridiales Family XIII bacterium]